ncbi:Protein of unknown function DUF374 [invertebrate metagenome]|uniref:DUF374 domain-containing protein n=1 Tax=invertebrate metagenome TaxID=1711999 RepID=A0A484H4U0_9ZZZZ
MRMRRLLRALSKCCFGWIHNGLCMLAAGYIRFVWVTSRWEVVGGEVPRRFWDADQPFVLAFWHGRLLMMPYCWNKSRIINMLISQHRDGQYIARTVAHFGVRRVAGSSSQGGHIALIAMLKALRAGESVGITPDGPRGPRMRVVLGGVVSLARLAGVPVIPVSFSASRALVLQSWDHFLVAWPFGRGVFVWGKPLSVPRAANSATIETCRQAIEQALNVVTAEADRRMGWSDEAACGTHL